MDSSKVIGKNQHIWQELAGGWTESPWQVDFLQSKYILMINVPKSSLRKVKDLQIVLTLFGASFVL